MTQTPVLITTTGPDKLGEQLGGSTTTEHVMRRAPCPVLAVPS